MRSGLILLSIIGAASALHPQPVPALRKPTMRPSSVLMAESASIPPGKATIPSSTINLVKAIVGSGVLSLPVGIAAFSSSKTAIVPATVLLAVIGVLSAYCFTMVARVVEGTKSVTWSEAWSKTVGEKSAWIPSSFVAILCFSASLQYTMVIGDSFSSIFKAAGFPARLASRTGAIGLVTALCTLPLSLLPSLEMLKYTSFLGIGGILYTAAFMIYRVAHYGPGSAFHSAVAPALQPAFAATSASIGASTMTMLRSSKTFVLVSILATAFCAHFIAPQFYNELAPGDDAKAASKLPRFGVLTGLGFALSAVLSAVVMAAGYLTFGGASNGYILNNYATTDRLAQAARMGIGGSIVCTYPLLHQGLRDTILETLASIGLTAGRVPTTLVCVALVTALGTVLTNLGTVAAVSGALVSTSLVYTLPSIMFGQLLSKKGSATSREKLELVGARALTLFGVVVTCIGMKAAF